MGEACLQFPALSYRLKLSHHELFAQSCHANCGPSGAQSPVCKLSKMRRLKIRGCVEFCTVQLVGFIANRPEFFEPACKLQNIYSELELKEWIQAVEIEFVEYLFNMVQIIGGYINAVVLKTVFPMSEVGQFMVTQFFKTVNI